MTTVVITDTTTPERIAACARQVLRTVPSGVVVVVLTHRSVRLPADLARRIGVHRVRFPGELPAAALELASATGLVVVVSSGCRTDRGWWDSVAASVEQGAGTVGVLTADVAVLSIHPISAGSQTPCAAVAELPGVVVVVAPRRTHLVASTSGGASPARAGGISACMIVKDEEEVLGECLAALAEFADEVVVYDTGSTDLTREIAAAHGARVVEGYWDDDFGAARERAQEHASHDWVLVVDADEVIVGDPQALRVFAARARGNVATALVISGEPGSEGGERSSQLTLYRRSELRWQNALHETLVARDGFEVRPEAEMAPVHFQHSGYQVTAMHERGKAERNVTLARRMALAAPVGDPDHASAWSAYGRSLFIADRHEEALDALARVLDAAPSPAVLVTASRTAIHLLTGLGRVAEAERWIAAVAPWEAPGAVALARVRARLKAGDPSGAREALAAVVPGRDLWGLPFDVRRATTPAILLAIMEEDLERADALLHEQVVTAPEEVDLSILVRFAALSGRPLEGYVRSSSTELLRRSLREAVTMAPEIALQWLSARHAVALEDVEVLVAGCVVSARAGLAEMLTWSLRAREAGMIDPCPLRIFSDDPANDAVERCLAQGIAADAYGNPDDLARFHALRAGLDQDCLGALEPLLAELAPGLSSTTTA